MRKLAILLLAVVLGFYLTLGGGLARYEEYRVRGALVEAGVGGKHAACMARRMVKRLDLMQLWKLQHFAGKKRSLDAYLRGIRRVDDNEAVSVTVNSAALCAIGLTH